MARTNQYITVHLSKEEVTALEEMARLTGVKKGNIARQAISQFLAPYIKDRDQAYKELVEKYSGVGADERYRN